MERIFFSFLQYSTNALRKLRAKINSLNFRVGINDGLSLFKLRRHFHSSITAQTVGCLLGWLQEAMNGVMCPWCGDMKERTLVPEDNQR